jgi:DNA-binding NtrC family response regulator
MARRLLVIDNADSPVEDWLDGVFGGNAAAEVDRVRWRSFVPEELHKSRADLLLLVAATPLPEAVRLFHCLRSLAGSHPPAIAVVSDRVSDEFLELVTRSVDDFVMTPLRVAELHCRIARMLKEEDQPNTGMHERLAQEVALTGLIGSDPTFMRMLRKLSLAASSEAPVLIVGETGTGKELCARAIHILSTRRNFAFIPVDCATLPEHLFENELFGHIRGAFTDARQDQKGLVELARRGTLFLDEIDSLSPSAQAKLLRFLQEHTYRPLGSEQFFKADVRIVAASNRNLEDLVRLKEMRSDLFFRLDVLRLQIAPLRERPDDVIQLANHFLAEMCAAKGGVKRTFAHLTLRRLVQYHWPGNVRELYNAVQRGFTFSEGAEILSSHIFEESPAPTVSTSTESYRQAKLRVLEAFERNYVGELMRECDGNITRAARIAKKDRRDFGRLVKRYATQI